MRIDFKNILAGLGSAVIVIVSLYVGLYSDASSLGLFSTNVSPTSLNLNDANNDGNNEVTVTIVKEVEPEVESKNQFEFQISINSQKAGTFYPQDNENEPISSPKFKGVSFLAKVGVPYTITETQARDGRGNYILGTYRTSYRCVVPSNKTQTDRVIEGYGTTVTITPQSEGSVCTFTNDSSSSITAITEDIGLKTESLVYDNQTITAGAYKFSAVKDPYRVTEITLSLANATVANKIELYDGSTLIASLPASKSMIFSGLSWLVPANSSKILTVKLALGSIGTGSGISGSSQLVTMNEFSATNMNTGVNKLGTERDPKLAQMYAYASIPEIFSYSLSNTNLILGNQIVHKFSVLSLGGELSWKKVVFKISKNIGGVDTLTKPALKDQNGKEILGSFVFTGGVDRDNGKSGNLIFVANNEELVKDKAYTLSLSVNGQLNSGNYLSTNIEQTSNKYSTPNTYTAVAGTPSSFVWSDLSASNHSALTRDWNNGYIIDTLPTSISALFY